MIRLLMQSIKPTIEAIPWVERYGSLAWPLTIQLESEGDGVTTKTVPYSNYVSQVDCAEESDRYFLLTPDEDKKSIIYFEQAGNCSFSPSPKGHSRYRNQMQGSQNFRLVCWVNLDKIGLVDDSANSLLAAEIYGAVDGLKVDRLHPDLSLPITNIKWTVTAEIAKTLSIFASYSYNDFGSFLMYPYEFFAFEVNCQFLIKKDCISSYVPEDPICVDQNNPAVLASFSGAPWGSLSGDPLTKIPQ